MIFARTRENHRMRVREKGKSMGKVGRGDERRYMGVCSDGFRRTRVDQENDGGYADAKTRKQGWGGSEKVGKKYSMTRGNWGSEGASGYERKVGKE